jgi:hypothetical protein
MGFDLFDEFVGVFRFLRWGEAREVLAGDLEGVEDEAGSFGVDGVGGEAAEDFSEAGLDGGAVFREWNVEGGAVWAGGLAGCGFAGGVVVIAELFGAECFGTAAVAVREDVAALIGFGFVDLVCCHAVTPHRSKSLEVRD